MASHLKDDVLHGHDHSSAHASDSKWRHQESSSYARHAEKDSFLNTARVQQGGHDAGKVHPHGVDYGAAAQNGTGVVGEGAMQDGDSGMRTVVKCGPLLNYRRMDTEKKTWLGSVLVVTGGGENTEPLLRLRTTSSGNQNELGDGNLDGAGGSKHLNNESDGMNGLNGAEAQTNSTHMTNGAGNDNEITVQGVKLYADPVNTFWRFNLEVPMKDSDVRCEYTISSLKYAETKAEKQIFHVPALNESMRIMFHSCNGFSVGTDEEAFSGACLWNDVRRVHEKTPFHVMLGGGDQIYNDGIRVNGPLKTWTKIGNPIKRKEYPFPEQLRKECDEYYVNNYIRWYSTEPFAAANGQIPQINLWDDHDIIDGFGSYTDEFMHCPVFRGIGGVAHKYYLLFQHHLAPPASTYTTDAPQTTSTNGVGKDPRQTENTYVLEDDAVDPTYVMGPKAGPYVAEHSRSIVTRLGARIGFFGIDARTERTRKQVNYPETYDLIFSRLRKDLSAATSSPTPIKHLVVLLGIPIAYPRLTWLENIFTSPIVAPIKFLNRRFGFGGGFFNQFDGNIDLLDDLDDHYTARTHKKERQFIVHQLQALAAEFSVRITILGGDVHLAAVGRFYSNPKLEIPVGSDHRYMANIISSAIVNKPPPQAIANLLARRNKLHHLDHNTDETLMKFFDNDPGNASKTASSNHVTMPSRNWAMITENAPIGSEIPALNSNTANGIATNGTSTADGPDSPAPQTMKFKDGHSWLHDGETDAGTKHRAAAPETHGSAHDGSLDVCIRVEMDQHDKEGKTQGYGMTIPTLVYDNTAEHANPRKRDAIQGAIHHRK